MHLEEFEGILQESDIDFNAYLAETDHAEKVRPASDYLDDVMNVFNQAPDGIRSPRIPFNGAWLDFRPAEVTVWGGYNDSGKSLLQGQILADICEKGGSACIASMEMKPGKTLARMSRQICNAALPQRRDVDNFLTRNKGRLWLYDQQGTVQTDRMLAVIKHCAVKLGCQHIAIDSLMKCVKGTKDYDAQKDFVDQSTAAARDFNTHIHLVAHFKKPDDDNRMPNRYDLKGASEISDLADNVIIIWRNKKKEQDIAAKKDVEDSVPDSMLIVDKQRNGEGWEGRIKLWYEPSSMKFNDFHRPRGIL